MGATNPWIVQMSILIANLIFNLISQSISYDLPFKFSRQTVSKVKMWTRDVRVLHFQDPEERHKVCMYAKMEANLPYISYNYDRSWRDWERENLANAYGINCGTLPSMYLVRSVDSQELIITHLESSVNEYKFNATIRWADSASPREQGKSWSHRGKYLIDLSDEDRKNLCDTARQHVSIPLYFLDHNVPEVRSYEFEYSNMEPEDAHAISCPTLPQLFILGHDLGKDLDLLLLPSFINDYEFELENASPLSVRLANTETRSKSKVYGDSLIQLEPSDRRNLCNITRQYYATWLSPFVEDTDVLRARPYFLGYSQNEKEIESVALFCSALPSLYLREDNSNGKNKIKITFAPNPAHRYTYKWEIIQSISKLDDDVPKEEVEKLEKHPSASLNKEDCWNLCYAAQEFLLSDPNRWIFKFATKERIFTDHSLLLIPEYVRLPEIKSIGKWDDYSTRIDLVVQCSRWPRLNISLAESDTGVVKMMLFRFDLVQ